MDNKGFTLIELIITVVILALIMSIGTYSIISIVNSTKQKNYESLIENIKAAVESYAIECKYAQSSSISCSSQVTLGYLVENGYLSGNSKIGGNGDNKDKYTLVNPSDNKSIANCRVKYTYSGGKVTVSAVSPSGSCPTSY